MVDLFHDRSSDGKAENYPVDWSLVPSAEEMRTNWNDATIRADTSKAILPALSIEGMVGGIINSNSNGSFSFSANPEKADGSTGSEATGAKGQSDSSSSTAKSDGPVGAKGGSEASSIAAGADTAAGANGDRRLGPGGRRPLKVGDTVMHKGQQKTVLGFTEGGVVFHTNGTTMYEMYKNRRFQTKAELVTLEPIAGVNGHYVSSLYPGEVFSFLREVETSNGKLWSAVRIPGAENVALGSLSDSILHGTDTSAGNSSQRSKRPPRELPNSGKTVGSTTSVNPDGSLSERTSVRPTLAKLEPRHIELMEGEAKRRRSAGDAKGAEAIEKTVANLKGVNGPELQRESQRLMLEELRKSQRSGRGRAAVALVISGAVLATAALTVAKGCASQERELPRPKVQKR